MAEVTAGGAERISQTGRGAHRDHPLALLRVPGQDDRQLHVLGLPRVGAGLRLRSGLRGRAGRPAAGGLRVEPVPPGRARGKRQRAPAGPDHRIRSWTSRHRPAAFPGILPHRCWRSSGKVEEKLSHMDETPLVEDPGPGLRRHEQQIAAALRRQSSTSRERSGLAPHGNSTFPARLAAARSGRFSDLLTGSMKNGPVKKPPKTDTAGMDVYEHIETAWHAGRSSGGRVRRGVGPRLLPALPPPARGAVRIA